MSESLLDKTNRMIEGLKEAKFLQGIEEFYADDAVNEEPTGEKTQGKKLIYENQVKRMQQVAAFNGVELRSIGAGEDDGAGNGVTFAEYKISVEKKDGSKFSPDQVQVTRWEGGKAKHIKFYYNPDF